MSAEFGNTGANLEIMNQNPALFKTEIVDLPVSLPIKLLTHQERVQQLNDQLIQQGADPMNLTPDQYELRKKLVTQRRAEAVAVRSEHGETLKAIAEQYAKIDQDLAGQAPEIILAGRCVAMGGQLAVRSDFDGTCSKDPDSYLPRIPGSALAEPMLEEHGRANFSRVFAATWGELLKTHPEDFGNAGREGINYRDGIGAVVQDLEADGDTFEVLSANFEPFAKAAVGNIPGAEHVKVTAITHDNMNASDKGVQLMKTAAQNSDRATLFIGDGSSDLPAMRARDVVAAYFALEGSSFAQQLEKEDILHFTYNDFNDIGAKIREVKEIMQQMK